MNKKVDKAHVKFDKLLAFKEKLAGSQSRYMITNLIIKRLVYT